MALLNREPEGGIASAAELLGVALALEEEAVRRYGQLAALMEARGDGATAATFRALVEEERDHVAGVAAWAQAAVGQVPATAPYLWRLPPEIAESWDELAVRSTLTPYDALSVAVQNEERAFAFYAYVAARADDPAVRRQAESLAAEEVRHAALLRKERRKAYRRRGRLAPPPATLPELAARAGALAAAAAARHGALAAALAGLGDAEGADLLGRIADAERTLAAGAAAPAAPVPELTPVQALRAAMAPVEALFELAAATAERAGDEALLAEAQRLLEQATAQLGLLAAAVERRSG